jgi:8-oxo-dGTP pyrophosphatase MutT (NUDIX family)
MADRHLIDVYVLLVNDDDILLTQRRDPNPDFDGLWHLPSGKHDAGGPVLDAAVREAEEEVGVLTDPTCLRHVRTVYVNGSGPEPRLGLFFKAVRWIDESTNRESDKCSAVRWFPLDALPARLVDCPASGISAYRNSATFSVRGWTTQRVTGATRDISVQDRPTRRRARMNTATTEIIVRAVIRRDGRLLLARQHTKSWSFLPGGHVEPGERLEIALARELAEELGTEAKVMGFVGAVEHGYIQDGTTHHEINLVFEVDINNAQPVSQEDHLEFYWLSLDHLAEADVRPETLKNALAAAGDTRAPFWRGWNG